MLTAVVISGWVGIAPTNGAEPPAAMGPMPAAPMSRDALDYLEALPRDAQVSLYTRPIPDQRKQYTSGVAVIELDAVPPWHQAAPVEEKPQRLIEGIKALSKGVRFTDTGISWHGPTYSVTTSHFPLNLILMGGEDNIRKANEFIVARGSEGKSGVGPFGFGDDELYYLYFQHQENLTAAAKQTLYDVIVKAGTDPKYAGHGVGRAYNKNLLQNHNQIIHGWHLGILYAKAANDTEMMGKMEHALDRMIANAALQGFAHTEYNSPSYGPFIWNMLLTVYSVIDHARIEAKLRLLLDLTGLDVAERFHAPTANLPGPHSRMSPGAPWANSGKYPFQLFLYRFSNEYVFWQHNLGQGYAYCWSLLASMRPHFPDYMQDIAFRKPFPYRVWSANINSETSQNAPGSAWKMQDTVAYSTEEYTIGSKSDPYWRWNTGQGGQDGFPVAYWRRTPGPVQSHSDSGSLSWNYRYNGKQHLKTIGVPACVQYQNKAIVLSYPGRVHDEDLATHAQVDGKQISSMATTVYLRWPAEIDGIWVEDEFVMGERSLARTDTQEIRAKATGPTGMPYAVKGRKTIFIEDYHTYIALQPLNSTSLGRDVDAELALERAGGTPLLTISFYNYRGHPRTITPATREQQRNGYILEFGDQTQFPTMAHFKEHIRSTSFEQTQEEKLWVATYSSGDDILEIQFDTERLHTAKRVINGRQQNERLFTVPDEIRQPEDVAHLYDWMAIEPWKSQMPELMRSNCTVKSKAREIAVGEAKLANPGAAMVYLVAAPNKNIYVLGNLTRQTRDFTLTTPQGIVEIKDLNLGRVIFRPDNAENPLEIDPVPGMTERKTQATQKPAQ